MQVKFIKTHTAGFKEGAEANLRTSHALRLQKEGYVELLEEPTEDEMALFEKQTKPNTKKVTLSKKSIEKGIYGDLAKGKKPGDVIEVPVLE